MLFISEFCKSIKGIKSIKILGGPEPVPSNPFPLFTHRARTYNVEKQKSNNY